MIELQHTKPFTVCRFLHEIVREKDGKELVRLRVNWA
jgi:hypothetical protein